MPIAKPTRRLFRDLPLRFVAKRVGGDQHRPINTSLSLTSMIDFLVVTVVFLLITFSASAEPCIAKGVATPFAANGIDMIDAPIVLIAGSDILVDGNAAGNTRRIAETKTLQRVDELFNALSGKREVWRQLHPGRTFPGTVLLTIDQDVPAIVVKSVFQTAAHAGYPNVSFVVGTVPSPKR